VPVVRLAGGDLDGVAVHYIAAGSPGSGPATVLVHGLASFAESWRHLVVPLACHGRVLALDLPGFGQSAKPRRAYRLGVLVEALAGFLRALGLQRVTLVGHSLGGGVAAAFTLAHPAAVERLALISAAVPGFELRLSWLYRVLATRGLGEVLASLVTRRLCTAALARCFHRPVAEEVRFFVEHAYAERAGAAARAAYLATLRGATVDYTAEAARYREGLRGLPQPVLLIHGLQDRVVPVEHGRQVAAALPRVEARWMDGCGHFPQIEHPEAVAGWLTAFCRQPVEPGPGPAAQTW
jgi:pimeloyl-ACP methyl ester carboxylesterase